MSGKITDARIEQLNSLRDKRDELIGKIQKEKEGMQTILDSMDEVTQDSTQSSSRAAKDKRGREKDKSNFSHDDAIEIHQMAIKRLEEDYAHVVEELEVAVRKQDVLGRAFPLGGIGRAGLADHADRRRRHPRVQPGRGAGAVPV